MTHPLFISGVSVFWAMCDHKRGGGGGVFKFKFFKTRIWCGEEAMCKGSRCN